MTEFEQGILRTLLYYEIFDHPLTMDELFLFFFRNGMTKSHFSEKLNALVQQHRILESGGVYQIFGAGKSLAAVRKKREQSARQLFRIALIIGQIIRRFPFVRGVFLSGELSKGVATPTSDIDFVIITAPKRLWICRTILIVFKKVFLLNSKRFFCLNYFITEHYLEVDEHNYYTATEVAHLKPLSNFPLFLKYMNANNWVKEFFPNYSLHECIKHEPAEHLSVLQLLVERMFPKKVSDALDNYLMNKMKQIWSTRYPQFNKDDRDKIFRSTDNESRAFVGNFGEKILALYRAKLQQHSLT